MSGMRIAKLVGLLSVSGFVLAACQPTTIDHKWVETTPGGAEVMYTSPVSRNITPYDPVFECYGQKLKAAGRSGVSYAVGNIKDYTGKNDSDNGFAITQGGALMAYTALGKAAPGVTIYERFDTTIADAELRYIKERQLGDGGLHEVDNADTGGVDQVPWMPYYGGSVLQSDYYIVGGVTEVNYNIQSGGAEFQVNQIGPKQRTYTMNVAVDLRVVGSQTLKVYDTVSIQKQVTGYEVGADVYRFFDSNLFDINIGEKTQEPLQLGVRMAVEAGILDLLQGVSGVSVSDCMVVPSPFSDLVQPAVSERPSVQSHDFIDPTEGKL